MEKEDDATEILNKLGQLKCDFSSIETGTLKDAQQFRRDIDGIKGLKKKDITKLEKLIDTKKPLKTIQRVMILHDINVAKIYQISMELKHLFKW